MISSYHSVVILYTSFLLTYIFTSLYCFRKDLKSTQIRLSINKIQGTTRRDIIKTYRKCTGLVFKNIFVTIPLLCFFLQSLAPTELFRLSDIAKFPINFILIEFLFYSTHRIMHIGFLYKRYHKKHHEIPIPVSISALYLHPVDLIFSNFFRQTFS